MRGAVIKKLVWSPVLHCMCITATGTVFNTTNRNPNTVKKMHGIWMDVCWSAFNVFVDPNWCFFLNVNTVVITYVLPLTDSATSAAVTGTSLAPSYLPFCFFLLKKLHPALDWLCILCTDCRLCLWAALYMTSNTQCCWLFFHSGAFTAWQWCHHCASTC